MASASLPIAPIAPNERAVCVHPQIDPLGIPTVKPPGNIDRELKAVGQGSFGIVYMVLVSKTQYAAGKTISLTHSRHTPEVAMALAAREHALLVRARRSKAPNVLYA